MQYSENIIASIQFTYTVSYYKPLHFFLISIVMTIWCIIHFVLLLTVLSCSWTSLGWAVYEHPSCLHCITKQEKKNKFWIQFIKTAIFRYQFSDIKMRNTIHLGIFYILQILWIWARSICNLYYSWLCLYLFLQFLKYFRTHNN